MPAQLRNRPHTDRQRRQTGPGLEIRGPTLFLEGSFCLCIADLQQKMPETPVMTKASPLSWRTRSGRSFQTENFRRRSLLHPVDRRQRLLCDLPHHRDITVTVWHSSKGGQVSEQNRSFAEARIYSQLPVNEGSKGIHGARKVFSKWRRVTTWGREVTLHRITIKCAWQTRHNSSLLTT